MVRKMVFFQIGLAFVLGSGASAAEDWPPAEKMKNSVGMTRFAVGPHRTLSEMNVFVGSVPERCEEISNTTRICLWSLSKAEPGWHPLAAALATGDRLYLLCEFPKGDGPREELSCSAHPKRSNRAYFRSRLRKNDKRMSRTIRDKIAEEEAEKSNALLDEALTVFELSTLVGDIPDQCYTNAETVYCTWGSHKGTYGHGTLAMAIEASFSKKVKLLCSLPADGEDRKKDSCQVAIGG